MASRTSLKDIPAKKARSGKVGILRNSLQLDFTKVLRVSGRPVPRAILESMPVIFIRPLNGEPTLPFLNRTKEIFVATYLQGFSSIIGIPPIPAALIFHFTGTPRTRGTFQSYGP